jgi:hypothetical protein
VIREFATWCFLVRRVVSAIRISVTLSRPRSINSAVKTSMRRRLVYRSVSGTPVLNGDAVELNFITDPAIDRDDITVVMSRSELERLHRRISDRLFPNISDTEVAGPARSSEHGSPQHESSSTSR